MQKEHLAEAVMNQVKSLRTMRFHIIAQKADALMRDALSLIELFLVRKT
jgi:hypothetical protein